MELHADDGGDLDGSAVDKEGPVAPGCDGLLCRIAKQTVTGEDVQVFDAAGARDDGLHGDCALRPEEPSDTDRGGCE